MQYVPIEAVLEMSAIFAGVFFAVIAIIAVFHYSTDIRYRRWAFSHLLFWIAFLPLNFYGEFIYAGYFLSMLLKVHGSILVLRAFGFKPISRISNAKLHSTLSVILVLYWILVVALGLPITSIILSSSLMAFAFAYAGLEILHYPQIQTKTWLSAGWSFLFWSVTSIPMIFLPFLPELVFFGYLQFIGQALVLVAMFLSFFASITRQLARNLKLTEMTGSLISHDLRNFLNVTSGALDLVEPRDEESEILLRTARDSIEDAGHFIKDVRTMLIEIGTLSTVTVDLDLTEMVNKVITRAMQEHGLDATQVQFTTDETILACTSRLMGQVIWNIIDNGIKHTSDSPEITISILVHGYVILSISDRSGGMSDDLKERLVGTYKNGNGLGLGLMLIREISDVCSVGLRVEDRVENDAVVGTIYHLEFPSAGGIPPSQ